MSILFMMLLAFAMTQGAWTKRFDASTEDMPAGMATDVTGNIYVTGHYDNGAHGADFYTVKYSSSGQTIWEATYDGPDHSHDIASQVAVDPKGNVFVGGESRTTAGTWEYALVKYNSLGQVVWVRRGAPKPQVRDYDVRIVTDSAGSVILASNYINSAGNLDILVQKYSSAGVLKFTSTYDGPAHFADYATRVAVDSLGRTFVCGYSNNDITGGIDIVVLRYSPAGRLQRTFTQTGSQPGSRDFFQDMVLGADGSVYATGVIQRTDAGDCLTTKLDSDLKVVWTREYKTLSEDYDIGEGIAVDASGCVYVTGYSRVAGHGDILTLKYDASGTLLWEARKYYPNPDLSNGAGAFIGTDEDGNVYVAGTAFFGSFGSQNDLVVLSYTRDGAFRWADRFNQSVSGDDVPTGFVVDAKGNVYVTAYSSGGASGRDIITIKNPQSKYLKSVEIAPNSIMGGSIVPVFITVNLWGPAPAEGSQISLSKSSPTLTVPATVTVPGGATSLSIPLASIRVASDRYVTVWAANATGSVGASCLVRSSGVRSLQLSQNAITGGSGATCTGTVTLKSAAPTGGTRVALRSDDPCAHVPSEIVIPEGQLSGKFQITSDSIASQRSFFIWADASGGWPAQLTVEPPALLSFKANRSTVVGGSDKSVILTIKLNSPAPTGGITINLLSDTANVVDIPATIFIPAGSSTGNVAIAHHAVSTSTTVTFTATLNGGSKTTVLTLAPQ